jgi:ABC-type multidrug transport system permease subunit
MAGNAISTTLSLTKIRILLATRNRMFLFFSLAMPLGFLFFFHMLYGKGDSGSGWTSEILGSILTLTVMGGFWGLSVQLVTFREQGILRRFRLAPVGAGPMLASSILANYFLLLPPVIVEVIVARQLLHAATWGNLGVMFALVTIGSATFASLGLIIASVTNTMQETQIINQIVWMIFLFLSGATVPLTVFPQKVQYFTLFSPATYLATGLQSAAINKISEKVFIIDALALIFGMLMAFEISRRLFRWEPEAKMPSGSKVWVLVAMVPFFALGVWQCFDGTILTEVHKNIAFIDRGGLDQHAPPANGASAPAQNDDQQQDKQDNPEK